MWVSLTSFSAATNAATASNTRTAVTTTANTLRRRKCAIGAKVKRKAQDMVVLLKSRRWLRPQRQTNREFQAGPSTTGIKSSNTTAMIAPEGAPVALRHQDQPLAGTSFSRMLCVKRLYLVVGRNIINLII
ncbi:hypothetical protein CsatB_003399 [Cannabis sativa]